MLGLSAFMCGWLAGMIAVGIWFLYGDDVLPQLKRHVTKVLVHIPWLAPPIKDSAARQTHRQPIDSASAARCFTHFESLAADRRLEGLTGSTRRFTSITASARCVIGWYGADGTISAPMECRLSLEDNVVTVYQVLRSTRWNHNTMSPHMPDAVNVPSDGSGHIRGSFSKSKDIHHDAKASHASTGVKFLERRRGDVCLRNTTVMEVKQFNSKKRTSAPASEQPPHSACDRSSVGTVAGAGVSGISGTDACSEKASSKGTSSFRLGRLLRKARLGRGNVEKTDKREDRLDDWMSSQRRSQGQRSDTASDAAMTESSEVPAHSSLPGGVAPDSYFTGRVLIWRTIDGRPLFDSFTPQDQPPGNRGCSGSFSDSRISSVPFATPHSRCGDAARTPYTPTPTPTESLPSRSACSCSDADDREECTSMDAAVERPQSHHRCDHQSQSMMGDTSRWSCVIMKFERSRESERWHTLLSGCEEAQAWHRYAKTLPNPNTINTLLSRFFFQNMPLNGLSDALITLIRKKLRELPSRKFPRDLGGDIILDDFLVGTQIPWISDVSEPTVSTNGEVCFDLNLLYKGGEGGLTLFFRLALTYRGIRVPHIIFSVKLLELEATLYVSIGPPPSKKFWVGAHKPPVLQLEVHQGCASGKGVLHRILRSLPDLSSMVTNFLKLYLFSDMVLPYMEDFPLPSVVRSPKGSFADLRVRTFDWQRAAKISGAPERGPSTVRVRNHGSGTREKTTQRDARQEEDISPRELLAVSAGGRDDTARVSVPGVPSRASMGDATTDSTVALHQAGPGDSSQSRDPKMGLAVKQQGLTSRDESSNDGCIGGSLCQRASIKTGSPMGLTSSPGRSTAQAARGAAAGQPGQTAAKDRGDPARSFSMGSQAMSSSCNTSLQSIYMPTSALDEMLSCDDSARSDSNGVLSSGRRGGFGKSSAMRNLKDLLKLKGSDMFRESVSRSKKKK
ncbi:hypothetical protein JKF63_07528 [Porcisia hertigi]|uniref:SMP-LTD domain-containing protein n=1 Tax=Porcisia hertigi TaxID=2761500 RepID=A0A836IUL0_9TRYP|nr:hypothetical protein JKF63_07528 [Porcisia hertigi]